MGTILELAREIRHHIVRHSTGRLEITFPDGVRSVDFSDGTVVTRHEDFSPCFEQPPLDWSFQPIEMPPPDALASGAALLIETLESLRPAALDRIWEPYQDWTLLLPQDSDIHNTRLREHRASGSGRLRRLLRLAVSGVLTLEPPPPQSIQQEMEDIRSAAASGDYWLALGVTRTASPEELRRAYRRLVRQFHPDCWHATDDDAMKARVEDVFRAVRHCYERAMAAVPRRLDAPAPEPPSEAPGPAPVASAVESYRTAARAAPDPAAFGLFRRILEKMFKAA